MGGNVKAHDTIAEIYDNNHTYIGLVGNKGFPKSSLH